MHLLVLVGIIICVHFSLTLSINSLSSLLPTVHPNTHVQFPITITVLALGLLPLHIRRILLVLRVPVPLGKCATLHLMGAA